MRVFMLALLVALGGCGTPATPTPTPGDLTAVRGQLLLAGITSRSVVGGESACPEVEALTDNSVRLVVTDPGTGEPADLYLYLFRLRDFEESEADAARCASVYEAAAGETVERVEVPPYRALGADWSPDLREAVEEALRAAATGG
jgi:hypothetical protein